MKKRSLFICLVALAAALLTAALASVSAFASSGTDKYGYVVDGADILTSAEEAELSAYLKEKSEKAGCDIIVVTTDDLGGKSMMEYADDFYDYNGYSDDGVISLSIFGEPCLHPELLEIIRTCLQLKNFSLLIET
ncbi:MAG: TPM domain-containing protein, partial [Clostridia bacterium]|nr:TPM domain-containing protein [Clostridia bacterium]